MLSDRLSKLTSALRNAYHRLNQLSGGRLAIVRQAFQGFNATRAGEAAAGMAYYAFFALFPLLLALIIAASFVLQRDVVQRQLLDIVTSVLPGARQIIIDNIQHVLEARGTVGLVALIGLIWSAAGGFDALLMNINRAWPAAEKRSFLERRAMSLMFIIGIALVLIVSLIASVVVNFLPQLSQLAGQPPPDSVSPVGWFARVLPIVLRVGTFWILYRWAPNTHVKNSAAFWGAVFAGAGWEIITAGFTLYLRSGLARYDLVYGSVGAIVALMFWIYWISWITLFGAHLSASIAESRS